MQNPKISIIVPMYNVEQYLDTFISSCKGQTERDFEMIIVDDGSTDESLNLAKKYASEDVRIKVFHKENGGVSSARNLALKNANGRYLVFWDPDY